MIVNAGDAMEAKVVRQVDRALQPLLTDVTVDWGGLAPLLQFPAAPAACRLLYLGSRAVLFAVVDPTKGVCVRFCVVVCGCVLWVLGTFVCG